MKVEQITASIIYNAWKYRYFHLLWLYFVILCMYRLKALLSSLLCWRSLSVASKRARVNIDVPSIQTNINVFSAILLSSNEFSENVCSSKTLYTVKNVKRSEFSRNENKQRRNRSLIKSDEIIIIIIDQDGMQMKFPNRIN